MPPGQPTPFCPLRQKRADRANGALAYGVCAAISTPPFPRNPTLYPRRSYGFNARCSRASPSGMRKVHVTAPSTTDAAVIFTYPAGRPFRASGTTLPTLATTASSATRSFHHGLHPRHLHRTTITPKSTRPVWPGFLCPLNPIGGGHLTDPDRATALHEAVAFHAAIGDLPLKVGVDAAVTIAADETAVRNTAEVFLAWLKGAVSMTLFAGPITNQFSGMPSGVPTPQGGTVQLHDNEQFDLTVDTKDAKGFETPDTVTWASADETVATVVVSLDGRTATIVAGNPGSTVITATDDAAGLSATEAIDVVPAGTATVSLVEGPVTTQP